MDIWLSHNDLYIYHQCFCLTAYFTLMSLNSLYMQLWWKVGASWSYTSSIHHQWSIWSLWGWFVKIGTEIESTVTKYSWRCMIVEQIIAYVRRIVQIMIQATDLVQIIYRGHPSRKKRGPRKISIWPPFSNMAAMGYPEILFFALRGSKCLRKIMIIIDLMF